MCQTLAVITTYVLSRATQWHSGWCCCLPAPGSWFNPELELLSALHTLLHSSLESPAHITGRWIDYSKLPLGVKLCVHGALWWTCIPSLVYSCPLPSFSGIVHCNHDQQKVAREADCINLAIKKTTTINNKTF